MAVQFDAVTTAQGLDTPSGQVTVSHTCTGQNRFLIVGVVNDSATTNVISVTYAGIKLMLLDRQVGPSSSVKAEMWYLVNPAGGPNNLTVTLSAQNDGGFYVASFNGVDQFRPIERYIKKRGSNNGNANTMFVTLGSNVFGSMIVDVFGWDATADSFTPMSPGQIEIADMQVDSWNRLVGSYLPMTIKGQGSVRWKNIGGINGWAQIGVCIRPFPFGPPIFTLT